MKHLITILLFLLPVSLSHAGLFGPSNYEECVLENVKTAQTDRAVSAVMLMCQDKFPKKVIPVLLKLSKGIKANLVCLGGESPPYTLTVDPRNKIINLQDGKLVKITNITSDSIFGLFAWETDKKTRLHLTLNTATGVLGGKLETLSKEGKSDYAPMGEKTCSEEK